MPFRSRPEISTLPAGGNPRSGARCGHSLALGGRQAGAVILDGRLLLDDRRFFLDDGQITASDETERTEFHESRPSNSSMAHWGWQCSYS